MTGIHTLWDEEAQRSELHFHGWILHGDPKATTALMEELHRLINTSATLRLHLLEISKTVDAAMRRAVDP